MNRQTFCITLLLLVPQAFACTQLPAATAFVFINDRDGDRTLNFSEWTNATLGENLTSAFIQGDTATFYQMDRDRNGKLEVREIGFQNVRYIMPPCEQRHSRTRLGQPNTALGFAR